MYNPIQISNYFINKSFETGKLLSPMKLLKLVYLAHGWNLGITGNSLLTEATQAWKYGPVIPSVYNAFKKYRDGGIDVLNDRVFQNEMDQKTSQLLDKVYEVYQDHDGLQLSSITHMEGSPWEITWNKSGGKNEFGVIIPNALIKAYYTDKVNQTKSNPNG